MSHSPRFAFAQAFPRLASSARIVLACSLWGCSDDSPSSPGDPAPTPPPPASIDLSSPPRGSMIQSGTLDDSQVTLTGAACDSLSTVTSVTIGGQPATLSGSPPCLGFTAQTSSRWGLNLVTGSARNAAGASRAFAQSYVRSPSYFLPATSLRSPGAGGGAEKVPGAYSIQLTQELIDDGNRSDADDFATLVNLALGTADLDDGISNPIASSGGAQINCDCLWPLEDIVQRSTGYRVTAGSISGGNPSIQFAHLTNDGITLRVHVAAISVPISVNGFVSSPCAVVCVTRLVPNETVHGTVSAPAFTFDPTITVSLGSDGRPVVSVAVDASGFDPSLDIDWGLLEFLDGPIGLGSLTNLIIDFFETYLEEYTEEVAAEELTAVMNEMLAGFELPPTLTLPPPMNVTLNVESTFDAIEFEAMDSMRLGFAVAVSPQDPVVASAFGSIRRDGDVPPFDPSGHALGVGIKDDLVNQILWAAWRAGAFENASPTSGCDTGEGEVLVTLTPPPVMMPGSAGSSIEVGLGDAYVDVDAPANVGLYASTIAAATLGLEPSGERIMLTLESDPPTAVQIVRAPDDANLDALAAQYGPVARCVVTALVGEVFASIPVPTPVIGAFGIPGVPAGARWVLSDAAVERQGLYHTFAGAVIVR